MTSCGPERSDASITLSNLEAQPKRPVTVVFFLLYFHVDQRKMPRDQFVLAEVVRSFDINTVAIRNAKQALRLSHHRANPLVHGIGQVNAGNDRYVRSGYSMDVVGMLSVE